MNKLMIYYNLFSSISTLSCISMQELFTTQFHKQTHIWVGPLKDWGLVTMADLLCRSCGSSSVQPCAESGKPCGPPTPGLLSDGTGITDCIGGPDKAGSPWRHYDHSLRERHDYQLQTECDRLVYLNGKSAAVVLTFVTLLTNLWPPCVSTFLIWATQEKMFT